MKVLEIPLKINADDALSKLRSLGQAGKEAGEQTADGMERSAGSFAMAAGEMLKFVGVTSAADELKKMVHAVGDEFKDVADYIARTSSEFVIFQQNMREAAVLSGKLPTTQYTKEQLELAKKGKIITSEEWRTGQEAWQHYGSQYVSDADKPGENLIEQSTVDEMLPSILGLAKARHIDQETAGRALGLIVAKMPKGTSADKYKEMFVKALGPAELSSGSAKQSFAELNKSVMPYVGEGTIFGGGEKGLLHASEFINMAMQTRPDEAATYSRDAWKMLKDMRHKGEFKELGITPEMEEDPNEIVAQIGREWRKSGKKWDDFITPHMHGRTAMQGSELMQSMILAAEKGLRKKLQGKQVGTGSDVERMIDEEVTSGPGGAVMESQAQTEIAEKEEGAENADAIAEMAKTKLQMTKDKEFSHVSLERTLLSLSRQFRLLNTSKDTKDEQLKYRTLNRLENEYIEHGGSQESLTKELDSYRDSSLSPEQEMQRLHDMIAQQTQIQRESHELNKERTEIARSANRPPLSARPPDHGNRN